MNPPCLNETPDSAGGWQAQLDLGFTRRAARTVLTHNRHRGPLVVQKALYPEGPATCHLAVLHPPGGIAAGDVLGLRADLNDGSQALLTTPGAAKWYRSEERWARQTLRFRLAERSLLEWLPRENILFDGARASMNVDVELAATAVYAGWEILSFGRIASEETWRRGALSLHTQLRREGRLLWSEVANVDAHNGFAESPVGLANSPVCGTFLVASPAIDAAVVKQCRELPSPSGDSRTGITCPPGLLIARYLGGSTEEAFEWFVSVWTILRQPLLGKPAQAPRLWAC